MVHEELFFFIKFSTCLLKFHESFTKSLACEGGGGLHENTVHSLWGYSGWEMRDSNQGPMRPMTLQSRSALTLAQNVRTKLYR